MNVSIKEIATAFSSHRFERAYPFIHQDIEWILVGDDRILGKENVIKACRQSLNYLSTVTTTFTKFQVLQSDNYIVIDAVAAYADIIEHISKVSSCDIYHFEYEKIVDITSYTIEL